MLSSLNRLFFCSDATPRLSTGGVYSTDLCTLYETVGWSSLEFLNYETLIWKESFYITSMQSGWLYQTPAQ